MKTIKFSSIIASIIGSVAMVANAAVIDFEADIEDYKLNGFSAVGHPLVTFSDTSGEDLYVGFFGIQGDGQSLAAYDDFDNSKIRMDFGVSLTAISLDFGNDDAGWADPSDRAWLELFNGGVSVGLVSMAMNLDDHMNQTIAYSGLAFDRAEFWYGDSLGNPDTDPGLIEIIDNITYDAPAVPDAGGTLGLAALGLAGLAALRRRRVT